MKGVLGLSAYRRLLAAYTLNELANSIGALALTVFVYRRTGSAIGAASYFLCAQFVPALFAPAVVSRLDRQSARVVLAALYAGEAEIFVALAVITHHFSLAAVLILALLDGTLALTARAVARAATAAVLSPAGLLPEGNAMTNASFSICFMVGPAIGGVAVATGGVRAMLVVVAAGFAAIATLLLSSRQLPVPEPQPATGSARRVRGAIAELRRHQQLSRLFWLQALGILCFTISLPVEIVFVKHSLHAGDSGYGALLAVWGAGAIAGSVVYARFRRYPPRWLIAGSAAALGAGFVVMAAAPTLAVALCGAAVGGVGNGIEAVAVRTSLQEEVPDGWMGLMMGLTESVSQAMPGGGIVIGGAVAALAGARAALVVAGAAGFAIMLGAWLLLSPPSPARGELATAEARPLP